MGLPGLPGFGVDIPNPMDILFGDDLGSGGVKAPDFCITELAGSRRVIRLRGRALPYRPATWSGRQRTKITWYQGNPEATQQVLGPMEEPSVFEGKWKDRFIQGQMLVNDNPRAVESAEKAVLLFDDLRASGNPVQVQWGVNVRVGILVAFSASWDRLSDVAWRAEFEWSGRGRAKARAVKIPDHDVLGKMNALDDLLAFGLEDVVDRFVARTIDVVNEVREDVGEMFGILRAMNAAAAAPRQLVGALRAAVTSILLEAQEEGARMSESVAWGTSLFSDVVGPGGGGSMSATPNMAPLLKTERDRRAIADALMAVAGVALELQQEQLARVEPEIVAVVVIPEDTSFYALASRLYGDPDLAGYLARANGIKGTLVAPAGFELRVPPAPAAGEERQEC